MSKSESDRILSIEVVARRTGYAVKTVRNLISQREFPIPYIKRGKRVFFKNSSVNAYIRELKEIRPKRDGDLL